MRSCRSEADGGETKSVEFCGELQKCLSTRRTKLRKLGRRGRYRKRRQSLRAETKGSHQESTQSPVLSCALLKASPGMRIEGQMIFNNSARFDNGQPADPSQKIAAKTEWWWWRMPLVPRSGADRDHILCSTAYQLVSTPH